MGVLFYLYFLTLALLVLRKTAPAPNPDDLTLNDKDLNGKSFRKKWD